MLYLDKPIGPIKGMMIYRDHEDRNLFYYVPERPRLARNDGVPEFIYLKYKRDITDNPAFDPSTKAELGGGFLSFTVDLGIDDTQLDDIKHELSKFADGEVKLSPIQFRKGSVRLSISKDTADAPNAQPGQPRGLTFFEDPVGTSKPSLFGFNRATFTVVLTQEAATLFEAAFRSGISPIGVIYDLELLGLRPAFNVKITADYKRIYDHLEIQFGAKGEIYGVALAVDIGVAFQKLRDNGSIKVEVLSFTDDANLRKQADDAFDWFKKELLKDFFQSALEPPSFMKQPTNTDMVGRLQGLLQGFGASQPTASAVPVRGTPTQEPPTSAPPSRALADGVSPTSELNRTDATNTQNPGGGAHSGADTKVSPFQIGFSLKYYHQEELKVREFEYSEQAAVAQNVAPQGLFTTTIAGVNLSRAIKEVNLDSDFFKRLVTTVSISDDFAAAGLSMVGVNLEYPGERPATEEPMHVDGFVFKPDDLAPKIFTTWLNEKKQLTYRYKMDVHFKPDAVWVGKDAQATTDWIVVRDRQLILDPMNQLALSNIEIALGNMSSGQVSQVQAELSYEDTTNNFKVKQTFLMKPGDTSKYWKLRLSNPSLTMYQYRLTYFLQGDVRIQTDWLSSNDQTLVVNEPYKGTLDLRLVPLLDATTLLEADVDLVYHEGPTGYTRRIQKTFTPADLKSQPISIPTLMENPSTFTYTVTIIRTDGSSYVSPPITVDTPIAIISEGAGVTHRIQVKLPTRNITDAGLVAIKVDLQGLGDNPDIDTILFTPSQTDDKFPVLVQPDQGGPFTYKYTVTGYTDQGVPVPGDTGTASSSVLIVKIPTL